MWLSLLRSAPAPYATQAPPLFFHHIPKTAGTSLIQAMQAMTPAELQHTETGNLSAPFVADLVARGLRPGQFIYGHPLAGAALPLRGGARIVTLLRHPRSQAISNYLWVRKDKYVPDHALARQVSFAEFLLARPYFAIFQAGSLFTGIQQIELHRAEDLIDQLPAVFAYLEEMHLVGTVEQVQSFYARLATDMGNDRPRRLPRRNPTWVTRWRRAALAAEFEAVQHHPALAPLFAAEHAVYAKARALGRAAGLHEAE